MKFKILLNKSQERVHNSLILLFQTNTKNNFNHLEIIKLEL